MQGLPIVDDSAASAGGHSVISHEVVVSDIGTPVTGFQKGLLHKHDVNLVVP